MTRARSGLVKERISETGPRSFYPQGRRVVGGQGRFRAAAVRGGAQRLRVRDVVHGRSRAGPEAAVPLVCESAQRVGKSASRMLANRSARPSSSPNFGAFVRQMIAQRVRTGKIRHPWRAKVPAARALRSKHRLLHRGQRIHRQFVQPLCRGSRNLLYTQPREMSRERSTQFSKNSERYGAGIM